MKVIAGTFSVFATGVIVVLVLSGCGSNSSTTSVKSTPTTTPSTPTPAPTPTPMPTPSTGSVPPSNHVVIVNLENHSYEQVIGNPSMPYFNGLASQYGLATQYYANLHDSLIDLMLYTAGAQVVPGDTTHQIYNVDNIARQMETDRRSWKVYAGAMPSIGYLGYDKGNYMRHHNPFAYFSDIQGPLRDNMVPFETYFAQDVSGGTLPAYSYVIPNKYQDAHNGSLAQADAWMSSNLPQLLQSPQFQQDGILFIIWDEGDVNPKDMRGGGGRVANIVIGPRVKLGYRSTVTHNHFDFFATVCAALQLTACPANGATGKPMTEFFQ